MTRSEEVAQTRFSAQARTALMCGDLDRIGDLEREISAQLGPSHPLAAKLAFVREQIRDFRRPAASSVIAWQALEATTQPGPALDGTLTLIRVSHAVALRGRGLPRDFDQAVRLCSQPDSTVSLGADVLRRLELAASLLDRARFCPPRLTTHGGPSAVGDLDRAAEVIATAPEVDSRDMRLLHAGARAGVDVVFGLYETDADRRDRGRRALSTLGVTPEARAVGRELVETAGTRPFRHRIVGRLALLEAEALVLAGDTAQAERVARRYCAHVRVCRMCDPGAPWLVLARACADRDPSRARTLAERAARERARVLPEGSCLIAEAHAAANRTGAVPFDVVVPDAHRVGDVDLATSPGTVELIDRSGGS